MLNRGVLIEGGAEWSTNNKGSWIEMESVWEWIRRNYSFDMFFLLMDEVSIQTWAHFYSSL